MGQPSILEAQDGHRRRYLAWTVYTHTRTHAHTHTHVHFKSINMQSSITDNINIELDKICDWLAVNKLSLNASKSNYMIFHQRQKNLKSTSIPILEMNHTLIKQVNEFSFLGLTREREKRVYLQLHELDYNHTSAKYKIQDKSNRHISYIMYKTSINRATTTRSSHEIA